METLVVIRTLLCFIALVSHAESLKPSYEESLVDYEKALGGVLKWKWDPEPFCMSLAPEQVPAVSFQKAYIETVDIMLERAGCVKIRMEALHCEYNFIAARAEEVEWRKHFYVNGFNDDMFEVGVPRQSACNDPTTWIILYGIFGGVRTPRPVPAEPVVFRRFVSYEEEVSSVVSTETAFAEYYKDHGATKFVWNPKLVCELQVPDGYSFQLEYVAKRDIMLGWANCAKIEAEVLHCQYRKETILELSYELKWYYYAVGPVSELYFVGKSKCTNNCKWTIHYEIYAADKDTSATSSVEKTLKIFADQGRDEILRKRKWPQVPVEEEPILSATSPPPLSSS